MLTKLEICPICRRGSDLGNKSLCKSCTGQLQTNPSREKFYVPDDITIDILRRAHADIYNRIGWKQDSFDEEPYPANDDDYRRATIAGELEMVIENTRTSTITEDQIRDFLPSLDDEEVAEIAEAANTDSHESCEWLPWYKASMSVLIQCCGVLRALLEYPQSVRLEQQERVINTAGQLFYRHMLFAGIGPNRNPDTIRHVEEEASKAMDMFINKPCIEPRQ